MNKALSAVVGVLLCISLAVSVLSTAVRAAVRDENLERVLGKAELGKLDVSETSGEEGETLAEYIYRVTRKLPGWGDVTVRSLESALKEPVFTDFAFDMAVEYREVFADGEDPEGRGLIPEDIDQYMEDNDGALTDAMREAGVSGGYWLVILGAELVVDNLLEDRFSAENMLDRHPTVLGLARALLPGRSVTVLWEVSGILLLLMVLLSVRRPRSLWARLGLPVTLAGVLELAAWGTSLTVPVNTFRGILRSAAGPAVLTAGIVLAVLGACLLLLRIAFGPGPAAEARR